MKLADSRAPKLSQLTNSKKKPLARSAQKRTLTSLPTKVSAELRVECIHSPEQGLPFRLIDLPRRGPSGGMNGGWSQICMGLLNHKWRPEMQSLYYKSLYFEGLGPTFPRDTATIGLRVIGKGSDAKTVRFPLLLFPRVTRSGSLRMWPPVLSLLKTNTNRALNSPGARSCASRWSRSNARPRSIAWFSRSRRTTRFPTNASSA